MKDSSSFFILKIRKDVRPLRIAAALVRLQINLQTHGAVIGT